MGLIDDFDGVVRVAIDEGRFDMDLVQNPELARISDDLGGMLDMLPASVLEEALARARDRE